MSSGRSSGALSLTRTRHDKRGRKTKPRLLECFGLETLVLEDPLECNVFETSVKTEMCLTGDYQQAKPGFQTLFDGIQRVRLARV